MNIGAVLCQVTVCCATNNSTMNARELVDQALPERQTEERENANNFITNIEAAILEKMKGELVLTGPSDGQPVNEEEAKSNLKIAVTFISKVFAKLIAHLMNPSVQTALKLLANTAHAQVPAIIKIIETVIQQFFKNNLLDVSISFTKAIAYAYTKLGGTSATTAVLQSIFGSALNPIGVIADVSQLVLEYCGYKNEAKIVGGLGNTVGGAMAGFIVAGPPGAVIGAVAGLGLWHVGGYLGDAATYVYGRIQGT